MTIEIKDYSVTAASNNATPPDGAPENMARSAVNNVIREIMSHIAKGFKDTNGSLSSAGGTTAYTLAANRVTTAAYAGETFTFKANATNTGASTINITPSGGSARGAVAIQRNGTALAADELVIGGIYTITYDGTQYQLADSAPQNVATTATPRFARLGLGQAASATQILGITSAHATAEAVALTSSATGAAAGFFSDFSDTGSSVHNAFYGRSAGSAGNLFFAQATHATYVGTMIRAVASRAASAAYFLYKGESGAGGDVEFSVDGTGAVLSDTAASTPADYAEMFENAALGVLPVGKSVALVNGKVVLAEANPLLPVVGIVRPKGASSVVGNAHWARNHKARKTDKWGAKVTVDKGFVPAEDYVKPTPQNPYIPRWDRPAEWSIVGMLGQVAILKGQPKDARWVKMWDIDADTEMWLIR